MLILILPDSKEPFVVYCDASKMGLSDMLMHNGQVVGYALRELKVHERNYPTHDETFKDMSMSNGSSSNKYKY